HPLGAGASGTRLALLAVDRPAVLEIAEFAVRLVIIAQRRAAGLDRLAEDLAHRLGEPGGACAGDGRRQPARRDPGAVQGLAYIDVAEPGDDLLVEQRRLDRRHLAGELCRPVGAVELWL